MITPHEKLRINKYWQPNSKIEAYWQDHFYTQGRGYGYPIFITVKDPDDEQEQYGCIIAWSQSPVVCETKVADIDAYVAELDATWRLSHPLPDENARPEAASYPRPQDTGNALESGETE